MEMRGSVCNPSLWCPFAAKDNLLEITAIKVTRMVTLIWCHRIVELIGCVWNKVWGEWEAGRKQGQVGDCTIGC